MNFKQTLHDLVEAERKAKYWTNAVSDLKERVKSAMEEPENGFDSFKLPSGVCAVLDKLSLKASFKKEDTAKVKAWCKKLGIGDIFNEGVHPSTFSVSVRDLFDQGVELPAFIKTYTQRTLRILGRKNA